MSSANVEPATGATDGQPKKVKGRIRNVFIVAGTMAVDGADGGLMNTLFPVIKASMGLADSALGVLMSTARLISVVAGPFWVFLTKYVTRRTVLAIAGGFWGIWSIAAGFSQNFTQLIILYTLASAGFMAGHIFLPTIVGDSFEDAQRGRIVGLVYATLVGVNTLAGPAIALLSNVNEGWRYGFFGFGALNIIFGFITLFWFRDPGIGTVDGRTDGGEEGAKTEKDLSWAKVRELFQIRSFVILSISRLISPHPVLMAFGVLLLVQERGFTIPVAATIIAPFGIGYLLGNLLISWLGDAANKRSPNLGRVGLLQLAQFLWAIFALFATQFTYSSAIWYAVFFALIGSVQGWNPILNRPLVMAVVAPELRSAAFGFQISVIESISYSVLALITGFVADAIGISGAVFWTLIVVCFVNGVFLTLLYRPYVQDKATLASRLTHSSMA